MDATGSRYAPPVMAAKLSDQGMLHGSQTSTDQRARAASVIASASIGAPDLRLMAEMLGLSDTDLQNASRLLRQREEVTGASASSD
ncbi:hypothetical protein [Streptomyces sp. 1222.5]|uniref:hypothetical protein n=1 Tax=Streptomyces sp. 1222.5 TaxID=1881026 RepID=UPI003EB988E4